MISRCQWESYRCMGLSVGVYKQKHYCKRHMRIKANPDMLEVWSKYFRSREK